MRLVTLVPRKSSLAPNMLGGLTAALHVPRRSSPRPNRDMPDEYPTTLANAKRRARYTVILTLADHARCYAQRHGILTHVVRFLLVDRALVLLAIRHSAAEVAFVSYLQTLIPATLTSSHGLLYRLWVAVWCPSCAVLQECSCPYNIPTFAPTIPHYRIENFPSHISSMHIRVSRRFLSCYTQHASPPW